MRYATNYDVGDRKRPDGINEDSVAVAVFEQGHREGYRGERRPLGDDREGSEFAEDGDEGDDEEDADAPSDDPVDLPADEGSGVEAPQPPTAPANRSAGVFALADGAGGHEAGDAASYLASAVTVEELAPVAIRAARTDPGEFDLPEGVPSPESPTDDELQAAIEAAVVTAHRRVLEYAANEGTPAYTTLVAGVVVDGRVHYGWVGDSRAYVINRAREEIELLTKDHAVVEELADAGEIDDVEAHVHPRGNEITRAIGGAGDADPETATVPVETASVPLYAEDVLLVTSDGLIDAQTDAPDLYRQYLAADRDEAVADEVKERVVTDAEIRDLVLEAPDLDALVASGVELANERGGKDNVSLVALADDGLPETPSEGGLPVRAIDPDVPLEDRETVIVPEE